MRNCVLLLPRIQLHGRNSPGGTNTTIPSFSSANRLYHMFLGRLSKNVSTYDIQSYLTDTCQIPVIDINLNEQFHKNTRSASMRISIPLAYRDRIMDPSIWSPGCIIEKFILRRRSTSTLNRKSHPCSTKYALVTYCGGSENPEVSNFLL